MSISELRSNVASGYTFYRYISLQTAVYDGLALGNAIAGGTVDTMLLGWSESPIILNI